MLDVGGEQLREIFHVLGQQFGSLWGVFLTWMVQSHLHVHCLVPFQHDSVVYLNFGLAVKDSKSLLISVLKAH